MYAYIFLFTSRAPVCHPRTIQGKRRRGGHDEVVKALLETGTCDFERANLTGWNPTICAAEQGHLEALELLLAKGADINYQNPVRVGA